MAATDRHWYAVYTRPRHEKVAAEELARRNVECFLPLLERVSQWRDRRKSVQFPLFPGYLFVRARLREQRLDILKVPAVVRLVGSPAGPDPIPEQQIAAVRTLVFHQLELDPYPYLAEGDRVRITRGPLRGLEGILLEKRNRFTLVVSIDLIRQSVACEIDAAHVEKT